MNATAPRSVSPPTWHLASVPPPERRPFVYKLADGRFGFNAPGAAVAQDGIDEQEMSVAAIISTPAVDRVGDVVVPEGVVLDNYRNVSPVFFGHQILPFPLGSATNPRDGTLHVFPEPGRWVKSRCFFLQTGKWAETALDIFHMIVKGALKGVSIGLNPDPSYTKALATGGNRYERWDLLEWSFCGVGMNPECMALVSEFLSRGRIAGKSINPLLRKSLEPLAGPQAVWSHGVDLQARSDMAPALKDMLAGRKADLTAKAHAPAWNRLAKYAQGGEDSAPFDVGGQPSRPANAVYEWVSRHVGCEVKKLHQSSKGVPSARMGSFLTGLKHALAGTDCLDVRNLNGSGSEAPPVYATIQLNSKTSDDFLISGMAFHAGPEGKFVLEYSPTFGGLDITAYAEQGRKAAVQSLLQKAQAWAEANNFLKGEAFTLGGEFLERTAENWDDVILEEHNKASVARTMDLLNGKGKAFPSRGVIMTGAPGTGKTMSCRVIRNHAKATFIWVSSRDFHHSGSFGGISFGFDLAKELAPAVLCIEDVDNWLSERTIDLIKTEMDGISRSTGVLTILTTNFPERLPSALIDRPGRFHDVLRFDLPTPAARREMLKKWLPGLDAANIERAVSGTDGYSGAHVYELAHFAKVLQEHDGKNLGEALGLALEKVAEQRDLITELQLEGSHYNHVHRRKAVGGVVLKHIVHEGDKWVLYSHEGKVLGRHDTREEAVAQEQAIEANKHGGGKDMSGSDGTAGGYTVPPDGDGGTDDEDVTVSKEHLRTVFKLLKVLSAPRKALPPPAADPLAQQGDPLNPDADPLSQPPPPLDLPPQKDPREVLSRLVDALADFVEITDMKGPEAGTGAGAPGAMPPNAATPEAPFDELEEPGGGGDAEGQSPEEFGAEGEGEGGEEGEGEGGTGTDDEDEEDEDEDEERLSRYEFRGAPAPVAKGAPYPHANLHKRCKDVAHGAAMHCKEMGGKSAGSKLGHSFKAASAYYAKAMKGLCKEIDAAGAGDADGGADGAAPSEMKSFKSGMLKRCKAVMGDAAGHLGEMAALDADADLTHSAKAASLHHHRELLELHKGLGGAPPPEEVIESGPGADGDEQVAEVSPVEKSAAASGDALDFAAIKKELAAVRRDVSGVAQEWKRINGAMPT